MLNVKELQMQFPKCYTFVAILVYKCLLFVYYFVYVHDPYILKL